MIEIIIEVDETRTLKEMSVKGHSNFADIGKDIVCASVSILVYSAYASLLEVESLKCDFKDENDTLNLKVLKADNDALGELLGITIFLVKGFKLLEKKYKKNIKLVIGGKHGSS